VRTIVLIAILAIALAAAILALGVVYWLVRDQDRRKRERGQRA